MNFQPVLPVSGLPGWAFLNRTLERQTEIFDRSPLIERDTAYFERNIAGIRTAEDLVSDRRLLRVALGAFGLQDDLNSRAFIRQILEQGTADDSALANRLADDRYKQLADAFGFDDPAAPNTVNAGFGAEITARFRRIEFEIAVGDQDQAMRLAMNAQRALGELAGEDASDTAKWFRILGTPPLRSVFETALRLPEGFAQLDLDRQVEEFRDRAESRLGIKSIADLGDDVLRETLVRQFLVQDQISNVASLSSNAIALTLLQNAPRLF